MGTACVVFWARRSRATRIEFEGARYDVMAREQVRAVVERVFCDAGLARKRRLLMCAQRVDSALRPSEIARRYGRTAGAVSLPVRDLEGYTRKEPALRARFKRLTTLLAQGT